MTDEKLVKKIQKYLDEKRVYNIRLLAGKMFARYGQEQKEIKLCPLGTPTILTIIRGKSIFLNVKNNEKEKEKWFKKIERFKLSARICSYDFRDIIEYKTSLRIDKAGGQVYLVCSIEEAQNIINQSLDETN